LGQDLIVGNFTEQVAEHIAANSLFSRRQKILIAVSGGVDSMVLLNLLHELSAEHSWQLAIAHFNHQLRGRESDRDGAFVRKTAERLGMQFFVGEGDVASNAAASGDSIEMAARKCRHRYLAKTAQSWRCRKIALAHHNDDQVELFFLRLFRGAGIDGLTGMHPTSPSPEDSRLTLARPLLEATREDIEKYARDHKIRFREDASNRDPKHQRNQIRHELLPMLRREFQPALNSVVSRTMSLLAGESELADHGADQLVDSSAEFDEFPKGFRRRLMRNELIRLGIDPNFELVEQLLAQEGEIVSAPGGSRITRNREKLTTIPPRTGFEACEAITITPRTIWQSTSIGDTEVSYRDVRKKIPPHTEHDETFDLEQIGPEIILRRWQPGDRYVPIGMKKSVKLQDCFVNQKIPKAERHRLLIATTSTGEIFWVERLRIGELAKIGQNTSTMLQWRSRRSRRSV
jgi:tRNA(Ile)-lysidine synthase